MCTGTIHFPGRGKLIQAAEGESTLEFRSDIERGSVVMAGIEESKLTAKAYLPRGRVLISCTVGKALKRKLKELPNAVTRWDVYGAPDV